MSRTVLIDASQKLKRWLDGGAYGVPENGWRGLDAILVALPSLLEIQRLAESLHGDLTLIGLRFIPDEQGGHIELAGKIWRPTVEPLAREQGGKS